MVNVLVIFYEGTKPTKNNVEALANGLLTTSWCDGVTEIKHFDSDSISKAVLVDSIEPQKKRKGVRMISISDINETKRTQAAHQLENLLHISFTQAYDMLENGRITIPTDIDVDTITRIVCDNGGRITHGPSEYAVSQAVYYMNSFSDRLWDLVDIGRQIRNGVVTKETEAVKNAIEILNSKSFDGINRVNEKVRTLINIM